MTEDHEEWIGIGETARRLGISEGTVRRRIKEGRLISRRTNPPGGWRQLLASDVERFRREMEGDTGAEQ
jgi:excisionase family DNA binding protein